MAKRRARVLQARDGRTFIKGVAKCYACGNEVKYCLEQTLAITLVAADAILCQFHQWSDHDIPESQEHFINYTRVH